MEINKRDCFLNIFTTKHFQGICMEKTLLSILCLTILLAEQVWSREVQSTQVEVLAKSGSSWNGDKLHITRIFREND